MLIDSTLMRSDTALMARNSLILILQEAYPVLIRHAKSPLNPLIQAKNNGWAKLYLNQIWR
jgi:hypothetical protein